MVKELILYLVQRDRIIHRVKIDKETSANEEVEVDGKKVKKSEIRYSEKNTIRESELLRLVEVGASCFRN